MELERLDVIVGFLSEDVSIDGSVDDFRLLVRRALFKLEVIPLVVDLTGDGQITGELYLSGTLDSRVEVLEDTISIDIGEEVRWFDGVVPSTRASEIVCSRHW